MDSKGHPIIQTTKIRILTGGNTRPAGRHRNTKAVNRSIVRKGRGQKAEGRRKSGRQRAEGRRKSGQKAEGRRKSERQRVEGSTPHTLHPTPHIHSPLHSHPFCPLPSALCLIPPRLSPHFTYQMNSFNLHGFFQSLRHVIQR